MNISLRNLTRSLSLTVLFTALSALRVVAYDTTWLGATGDFFNLANWDTLVPTNNNSFQIVNGGTAVVDTNSVFYPGGPLFLNYWNLGDTTTGSGTLLINNGEIHMSEVVGDSYGSIGQNYNGASFVMNGGVVYYDGPQNDAAFAQTGNAYLTTGNNYLWANGAAIGHAGVNSLQFQLGVYNQGTTNCLLALHGDSALNVANQVDFGDASGGTSAHYQSAALVMDGNAQFNIGDGVGFGRDYSAFTLDLSGNARLVIGNSMGVGNTNGCSNQGFFALGSRTTSTTTWTIRDNASIHALMLKNAGYTSFLLTNNAFLGVYDVLAASAFNNPLAYTNTITCPLSDSFIGYQNCTLGIATFTVADHARFVVNSYSVSGSAANWPASATNSSGILLSNLVGGLSIGNGAYSKAANIGGGGANGLGGQLIVKDYGTFLDFQSLHLGTSGNSAVAGALVVVGPHASISISNELRMAISLTNQPMAGIGRLEAYITTNAHSTIHVGNQAWVTNGVLKVTLQGYTPVGGETYTLISAGSVDGVPKSADFTAAPLAPGLVWQVSSTPTTLLLKVVNTFAIQKAGANLNVSWQNQGATNTLQSSANPGFGYADIVPTATSPYTVYPTNAAKFFRLRR